MNKGKTHKPERMCVICRCRFLKEELTRYVIMNRDNQAGLYPDPKQKSAGRGSYVCQSPHCKEKFSKYKGLRKYIQGV